MQIVFALVALVVGFVLLVKGADWFVEGSAGIANKFGIPQIVIGLTIVAMGTSMPEAAVSISAALRGSAEITIGNVVGSNIMNILVILGLTAVVCQIAVQKTTIHYEIPMVIGVTILLAVMGLQNNIISRAEGVILLACMVVYMLYLLRLAKRGVVENEEMDAYAKQVSFGRLILLVVVGVAAIIFGSHVAVEAASAIARIFGISERFIGLTIVAFGTSLPELVTSVAAARRGNSDIAVGNIVVGITAVIVPVVYQPTFRVDSIVAVAAAVLLLVCVYRGRVLKRRHGLLMLACYGGYFAYLLLA